MVITGILKFVTGQLFKLSGDMIGRQLMGNTWSFKPITFEESVIFMITRSITAEYQLPLLFPMEFHFHLTFCFEDWANSTQPFGFRHT